MRYALSCLALLTACSSSNFDVAPAVSDTGTVVTDDTSTPPPDTTTPADEGVTDTGRPAEAAPPIDAACTALPADPATVYVDKTTKKPSKGTLDCPFATIREATMLVASLPMSATKHVIRVAGGPVGGAPNVYDEPVLTLKKDMSLVGDGPSRVTIVGGGTCGEAVCMVVMESGSALEGVTIDAKLGQKIPLAMGPALFAVVSVKNTTITGTKDDKTPGIYVEGFGWADIGPDTKIVDNGGWGILMSKGGVIRLLGTNAQPVVIERNLMGIQLTGGRLDVSGSAIVSNNKTHGVVLIMADKSPHVIDGLIAKDNVGFGLYVDGGAGLKLRNSKLVRNDIGLGFRLTVGNELDLGTVLNPGNNFIAGLTETNRRAGICLPSSRAGTSPARGNSWSACPTPTSGVMIEGEKACEAIPTMAYKDVYFGVPTGGTGTPVFPFETDGCTTK
jgi:hypothetical protein